MDGSALRVLNDAALDGPTNMARDEALLLRVGRGESVPTLRLYQWDPPTISLGYFQHYSDFASLPPPAGDLPVVRRLTGGGAILHDWELTYSLTLPIRHALLREGPNHLYELLHDVVIEAVGGAGTTAVRCGTSDDSGAAKGPFFCFARRHCYDVLVGADKLAGSAQRRTRHAVLQHGSIVLGNRFPQQPTASPVVEPSDLDGPGRFHRRVEKLRADLAEALRRRIADPIVAGTWTGNELTDADAIRGKYAGTAWTQRT